LTRQSTISEDAAILKKQGTEMVTKFVDLRREADVVAAKDRIAAAAMLQGVEVISNVSRWGVMLDGDAYKIDLILHAFDGRDVPPRPYDRGQVGDIGDGI
jgi:hypothetical protein